MASIIRIKRSSTAGNPSTLAAGELAYSALTDNGSNGGDRLYIGIGTETSGNAANHYIVGGKYYTDLMSGTAGTLTTNAKSVPILSSSGTIDKWLVGNMQLTGSTISATTANTNIVLSPSGTGKVQISGAWTLPSTAGTINYVLTADGSGGSTWSAPSASSFTLAANTGTSDTFNTGETLTFTGTAPIATAVSNNTITISATDATTAAKGVASFDSTNFSVTSGAVSIKTGGVPNTALANSSITINSTAVSLGGSITGLAVTSGTLAQFASTTSLQLATLISDETGSGALVFATSPTLVTPTLGVATATSINKVTITAPATSATLSIADGKTLTVSNSVTFSGTDASTVAFGSGGTVVYTANKLSVHAATTSAELAGVISDETGSGALVFANTPTLVTPVLGAATATSITASTGNLTLSAASGNNNVVLAPTGTGTIDASGKLITNLSTATPTNNSDVATKGYVDSVAQGLHVHAPVQAATTGTLSSLTSGGTVTYATGTNGVGATLTLQNALLTLDGYTLVNGDRILVKNQATQAHNGIYTWATGGTVLTRATGADTPAELAGGDFFFVVNGSLYGDTGWVQTEVVTTIGTSNIIFNQFSGAGTYAAGTGLTLTGSTFSVNASQTQVTALGTITTGTWTASPIANTYLANSSVTVNGTAISLGASGTITANTTNSITFTNTGGATAGTTFNGSAARTIDYSTVGASPLAGSSSLSTVGTITSGTWNGTAIASGYGGTGFTTYATGDMIYASAANTLSKLTAGASGTVLQVNSSGVPVWGDLDGGTY